MRWLSLYPYCAGGGYRISRPTTTLIVGRYVWFITIPNDFLIYVRILRNKAYGCSTKDLSVKPTINDILKVWRVLVDVKIEGVISFCRHVIGYLYVVL
jgi:hypothetical protein